MTNNYKLGTNSQCTLSRRVCDVRTFLGSFCWFFALLATFSLLFAHLIVVLSDKGWQLLLSCIDTTLLTYLLATLAQEQKRSEKEKKTCLVCIWRLQIIIRPIKTLVIYLFISVFILLAIFTLFFSFPVLFRFDMSKKKRDRQLKVAHWVVIQTKKEHDPLL
jgi:hypothetical protein